MIGVAGLMNERKCPKCWKKGVVSIMKWQPWGKPDYKWNCLRDGCDFCEISPWVGWGGPGEPVGPDGENR